MGKLLPLKVATPPLVTFLLLVTRFSSPEKVTRWSGDGITIPAKINKTGFILL